MFSSSCVAVLSFRAMDRGTDSRPFPAFPFPARPCQAAVLPCRAVNWNGDHPAGNTRGSPGAELHRGSPYHYVECGGVLLSHTLSSAVPSPRPGLSFRVRKGTGRLTWAMTTAKPIQRPTGKPAAGKRNQPHDRFRSWRSGNRTTDASNQTPYQYRPRDHKKTMLPAIQRENHHRTRPNPQGLESVPRSPVSTGRLHPSQGFHLRPIEHVFHMRATDAPKSVKES